MGWSAREPVGVDRSTDPSIPFVQKCPSSKASQSTSRWTIVRGTRHADFTVTSTNAGRTLAVRLPPQTVRPDCCKSQLELTGARESIGAGRSVRPLTFLQVTIFFPSIFLFHSLNLSSCAVSTLRHRYPVYPNQSLARRAITTKVSRSRLEPIGACQSRSEPAGVDWSLGRLKSSKRPAVDSLVSSPLLHLFFWCSLTLFSCPASIPCIDIRREACKRFYRPILWNPRCTDFRPYRRIVRSKSYPGPSDGPERRFFSGSQLEPIRVDWTSQ